MPSPRSKRLATVQAPRVHRSRYVTADLLDLIHRDHHDLDTQLSQLLQPCTEAEWQAALDAVVLGLTAHTEAEHLALRPLAEIPALRTILAEIRAEHLAQERALAALICAPPGSRCGTDRAEALQDLIHHHARREEAFLPSALRAHAPEAPAALAASYATERLRQLAHARPVELAATTGELRR